MASINAYLPGSYSGTMNAGTPAIFPIVVDSPSMNCPDITNSMPAVGNSYAVDCDFITLSDTGSVFYMDSDSQQLTLAAFVSANVSGVNDFTEEDILMIYSIETGFICTAILFFGLIRQFRKISPLLLS